MSELGNVARLWYDNRVTVSNAQGVFFANKPNIIHNQNQPAFGRPADTVTSTATYAKAGYFISNENGGLLAKDRRRFQKGISMKTLFFILRNPFRLSNLIGGAR